MSKNLFFPIKARFFWSSNVPYTVVMHSWLLKVEVVILLKVYRCTCTVHNWLEIPKVVTLPRFLMEHPVSFMYIHNNYVKILKRRKKIFGGFYWDSCPRSPRDRQSRPNHPQNTKKIYYCKVCIVNNFNQMVQSAPIYSCITFLPI